MSLSICRTVQLNLWWLSKTHARSWGFLAAGQKFPQVRVSSKVCMMLLCVSNLYACLSIFLSYLLMLSRLVVVEESTQCLVWNLPPSHSFLPPPPPPQSTKTQCYTTTNHLSIFIYIYIYIYTKFGMKIYFFKSWNQECTVCTKN